MAWENWPQTNVHELNLDWMLKKIKELEAQLTQDLTPVYNAISDGDKKTLTSSKQYTDVEISKIDKSIANNIATLTKGLYAYIDAGDYNTISIVSKMVVDVYDKIKQIDKDIIVYNPCRAKETTVEYAINDLYTYLAYGGISALESETVNVNSIDEYLSNVLKFDLSGRKHLIKILSDTYMFSAYDGIKKPIWNEVGLNTLNSQSISPPSEKFENVSVADVDNVNVKTFDFNYVKNE